MQLNANWSVLFDTRRFQVCLADICNLNIIPSNFVVELFYAIAFCIEMDGLMSICGVSHGGVSGIYKSLVIVTYLG